MKGLFTLIFLSLIITSIVAQSGSNGYNKTKLIVKFKSSSEEYVILRQEPAMKYVNGIKIGQANMSSRASNILNQLGALTIRPAKPTNDIKELPAGIQRIFFMDYKTESSSDRAYNRLKNDSNVEYVERDYIGKGSGQKLLKSVSTSPNDPGFGSQWGLLNTGQAINGVSGKPGADINITYAWDITTGNSSTKIAILDTGIPLTATEFSGRVLPGYDYVNDDSDPTDDYGHGTNVASIAAAAGNNSLGIAGINWNCKIIPVKTLDSNNLGYYSWWISGLVFAADNGAQVINMSEGGTSFSQALADAVTYANNAGAIVVACMMNDNNEVTNYPAGFDNVIAVGATNNQDQRAVPFCWGGGSNYGSHIDFVAPGDWILGLNYLNPNNTSYWCGTSQATPMVSGTISLMLGINPTLTFQQAYDILKSTSKDQIGEPSEDVSGWDKYYGWGRIDAYAAIRYTPDDISKEWAENFESYSTGSQPITWTFDGNGIDNSSNFIDNTIYNGGTKSLKLFGLLGSCWAALAYHPLLLKPPLKVEFAVRNGDETLTGCHPYRANVGLRKGDYWENPERLFVNFRNGNIYAGDDNTVLESFSTLNWYQIVITYEYSGTNAIKLSYWIDGNYKGSIVQAVSANEDSLNNFQLVVNEGSAWFDDIKVSPYYQVTPVELTELSAGVQKDKVNLRWHTATEINNYGFDVERTILSQGQLNNSQWEKIGFVSGNGNSNSPHDYVYTDFPSGGNCFGYRLKQNDTDGGFKYYGPLKVYLSNLQKELLMQNTPNPFNPTTTIKFYLPIMEKVSIKIYDILGREVTTVINKEATAGYHIVYWNGQNRFGVKVASGIYLYRLTAGSFAQTKKMVLLK